ncbi:MAG: 2-C-methyl-D-erythritol 2,4-cyclodiphosphate synthase [Clostridia bacterium]|nr:2-C-methyl-D-erythritol 2,4-cyclodiphosphate synthase [Clostridia bacterium]
MSTNFEKIDIVIPAAGSGSRVGATTNKLFLDIGGECVIEKTVSIFVSSPVVNRVILVCSTQDMQRMRDMFGDKVFYALGGDTRRESVINGLALVTTSKVLIHDGARPYLSSDLLGRIVEALSTHSAVIPVLPVTDTIKVVEGGLVKSTPRRETAYIVQTPQGFDTDELRRAYELAPHDITDDASAYEYVGEVYTVEGDRDNIKLTYLEDFLPKATPTLPNIDGYRVGLGIDAHRLVEGRPLILGGVRVDYPLGLLGHSDADVVLHAVSDAILSASNNRDIGYHFPDTDEDYKGADSAILLRRVVEMTLDKGYNIANVSVVIVCQKPKLRDYIPLIAKSIAEILGISTDKVSVSATTTERMGYAGEGQGIACESVATLYR